MPIESRRIHVLMVLESAFPAHRGGGAESQVRTLARALRARHQKVTVLTPLTPLGPQQRVSRVDGVPVVRLPYPRVRLLGGPWLWLRTAAFLWSRRQRYDVWHVHIAHYLGAVCALLGPWLQVPVVVKVSGWWELDRGTLAEHVSPMGRLARRCLLRVDAWQSISQRIAAALRSRGVPAARIVAISNAVDTARFSALKRNASEPGARFVFVGRLVPEKGLETLIDAFALLLREYPQSHLRIVGAGLLLGELTQRALAQGVATRIEFSGHREDVETLLSEADFGVLPSHIEGLSNTLLECMASGLPMIASRVSGSEDIVRDDVNGWLFEPGDCGGLTRALLAAARLSPAERDAMGARARDSVERHAGLDSVLDRLLHLYRNAGVVALPTAAKSKRSA